MRTLHEDVTAVQAVRLLHGHEDEAASSHLSSGEMVMDETDQRSIDVLLYPPDVMRLEKENAELRLQVYHLEMRHKMICRMLNQELERRRG